MQNTWEDNEQIIKDDPEFLDEGDFWMKSLSIEF